MQWSWRFVVPLALGLALLAVVGDVLLMRTARRWSERDLELRSKLAVEAARPALLGPWQQGDRRTLAEHLTDIARDERLLGLAACDGTTRVAASPLFPAAVSCDEASARLGGGSGWFEAVVGSAAPYHLSAVAVGEDEAPGAFLVFAHDLRFVARREDELRVMLAVALGVMALVASALTLVMTRLAWRGWTAGLRRALEGRDDAPAFQPLLRDVRALVQRLSETDHDRSAGRWTPERLRTVLQERLQGERVVIVANREPYIHERAADGTVKVLHPASGLVSALEPVMRACSGVWVAHGSGTADRETADDKGRVKVPPGEEAYVVRRVWLSPEEEQGYYYGFSNEGLWPLCHVAHARPVFRAEDWAAYQAVNQKFADAVCEEVDGDDPIILVQDYHFALAPKLIRARLPKATIITFWHIPWPNAERVGICPWRTELLDGLLGSSVVGFHTQQHCNNFIDAVDAYLESRIDREHHAVVRQEHRTLIRAYPISIEWPVHWLEKLPSPDECRRAVFAQLGLPENALLGVGVDRLDYTKGIEERLSAVERLLERFPEFKGRFTFVQVAAPSRTRIERYKELNDAVERVAARVNERFGAGAYRPVVLLRSHHEPAAVYRYLRAAHLCYVSSLHDGMNLVAKEFVAARTDEQGVLLLSRFTGAARELTEALIVNPYDLEEASAALASALRMSPEEQRERMRSMRSLVAELNVYRWAGRMLLDAAQLRYRERLHGRLTQPQLTAPHPT